MSENKVDVAELLEEARNDLVNQGNLPWWVEKHAQPILSALEQSQREVERLESVVTAHVGALDGMEAYLLDRTVSEPGSERGEKTLTVLRGYKSHLDRDSRQIAAARWADQKRHSAATERLEAFVARLRGALEACADAMAAQSNAAKTPSGMAHHMWDPEPLGRLARQALQGE